MNKKGGTAQLICIVLLGSILLLVGCSSIGLFGGMWKSNNPMGKKMTEFSSTVRPYRGNPESHYLLATYYQERGMHREAIREYKKVVTINPAHADAYNGLGVSYSSVRDFQQAIDSYKNALKLNSDLDYVHNNLGYSYMVSGSLDPAVEAFQKAIAINAKVKRYHNNLGLAYAKRDQFDMAFEEFIRADNEAKAHYNIAIVYYNKGLYHEAESHFSKALAIDPSFGAAKIWLDVTESLARAYPHSTEILNAETLIHDEKTFPLEAETAKKVIEVQQVLPMEPAVSETPVSAINHPPAARSTEMKEIEIPEPYIQISEKKVALTEQQNEPHIVHDKVNHNKDSEQLETEETLPARQATAEPQPQPAQQKISQPSKETTAQTVASETEKGRPEVQQALSIGPAVSETPVSAINHPPASRSTEIKEIEKPEPHIPISEKRVASTEHQNETHIVHDKVNHNKDSEQQETADTLPARQATTEPEPQPAQQTISQQPILQSVQTIKPWIDKKGVVHGIGLVVDKTIARNVDQDAPEYIKEVRNK